MYTRHLPPWINVLTVGCDFITHFGTLPTCCSSFINICGWYTHSYSHTHTHSSRTHEVTLIRLLMIWGCVHWPRLIGIIPTRGGFIPEVLNCRKGVENIDMYTVNTESKRPGPWMQHVQLWKPAMPSLSLDKVCTAAHTHKNECKKVIMFFNLYFFFWHEVNFKF